MKNLLKQTKTQSLLIIEKNPELEYTLQNTLSKYFKEIHSIKNIDKVLALKNTTFDVIIHEVSLNETTPQAQANLKEKYPNAKIIRTGSHSTGDILKKPYTIEELFNKIKN